MTISNSKIVLLADDHPVFRAGVRQYFADRTDFDLPIETGDGESCLKLLLELKPDWAVLDLAMPGMTGFQVLESLTNRNIATNFIIMSMHAEKAYADRAEQLGAVAFIAKEDAISELDHALAASQDKFYRSGSVGKATINALETEATEKLSNLTPTERKIFNLLAHGLTSKEIGSTLSISARTVQTHRRNMTEKLDLHGPNRLLEFAVRHRPL